ncbi:MAG: hypothetical protein NPINA01_25270 [Nitrospinaceae bacterium]|nr:MAG: hypothetical protein NPINA01_25270 [Nitrospinaceae bacterium]
MFMTEYLDSQDLLDQFWSDRYRHPEKAQDHERVENLLMCFRQVLDSSSKTAVAIDRDDPLNEIVRCAEKEGYVEMAQLLSV